VTILAYAPFILQLLLSYVLVRQKVYRVFPWFFAYTLFSIVAAIARFAFKNYETPYFYLYWGTDAVQSVLGGIVMYEVCRGVFRNLGRNWWARIVFPVLLLIAVALTLARTGAQLPGAEGTLMTWVVKAELGLRFLQVLLFLLLFALVTFVGVRWRQHHFGISAGYGIYAAVNLFTTTKYYESGTKFTFLWGWISVITYTVAVLIWLWYFSTPIKVEIASSEQPPLSLQDLERYKDIARRVPRP
jgi:hypothetical protein